MRQRLLDIGEFWNFLWQRFLTDRGPNSVV
jgi:hypothetical protein